ncbi:MAG: YbhB/YbcL family Raf kinase inhibitor-like protein [Pseudomonadota bacterium]
MNRILKGLAMTATLGVLTTGCSGVAQSQEAPAPQAPEPIEVTSSAFTNHANVPLEYTAYGDNISPQIVWGDLPEGTEQLALVMDDPIAPTPEPFVHWVVYNIPPTATELPEGMSREERITEPASLAGTINGVNGTGRAGYFGPRPPADGELHAYHFWVYALDTELDLEPGLGKRELLDTIEDHIIGAGMLMGHYERTE